MILRPYQETAIDNILTEWANGNKSTLLVMATGCGKTIVFSKVAEECVRQGKRVLILAHRKELLDQAESKINKATGLKCSNERGEEEICHNPWYMISISSVQTMMRDSRLKKFAKDFFDVIIVDEAHHAPSDSYQKVLKYFDSAKILGVTATADRADKKCLSEVFDNIAYEYDMATAIREGYLSPIKVQTIPINIDMHDVKVTAGDFQAADIGRVLEPYLDKIAEEMVTYCKGRKTVVFLPLVKTSQYFCELLNSKGFKAEEVNGNSKDRDEILKRFEDGKTNVLCNSMLLTEGWDCPSVDCIVCLRPTKSRALYVQIVGRGTRLHKGKKDLLLLDFLWNIDRHRLCRPAMLIAKNEQMENAMTKIANDGEIHDLEELQEEAERDVMAERMIKLKEELDSLRKRKRKLVDPLQYEYSIQSDLLASYVPTFGWECQPATDKQKETLEKFNIYPSADMTAGKAKLLIELLVNRCKAGLASPKQIRFLEQRKFNNVGLWTFAQANNMIKRIAASNWRIPRGINPETYNPADK